MKFNDSDEKLYGQATKEYEAGIIDGDLKAKAHVLAKGDTSGEKFEYIKLRVNQIRRENALSHKFFRGLAAASAARKEERSRKANETMRAAEEKRQRIAEKRQRIAEERQRIAEEQQRIGEEQQRVTEEFAPRIPPGGGW